MQQGSIWLANGWMVGWMDKHNIYRTVGAMSTAKTDIAIHLSRSPNRAFVWLTEWPIGTNSFNNSTASCFSEINNQSLVPRN